MFKLYTILLTVLLTGCSNMPKGDYYIAYLFTSKLDVPELAVFKDEKFCVRVKGDVSFETANSKATQYIRKVYRYPGHIMVIPDASPGGSNSHCPEWIRLDDL